MARNASHGTSVLSTMAIFPHVQAMRTTCTYQIPTRAVQWRCPSPVRSQRPNVDIAVNVGAQSTRLPSPPRCAIYLEVARERAV
jgi:hypothetical protein